jgi:estrogen-related receptor beta like 1
MKSREKYLNQQLEGFVTQLRTSHDKLAHAKETYNSQASGIAEKTAKLSEISTELEKLKNEMEQRGQTISDGKPIQQAKKAIAQLTKENCGLDIRIGVIEHEINQQLLKIAQVH